MGKWDSDLQPEAYTKEYNKLLVRLTRDFIAKYCTSDGDIKWDLITQLNAGIPKSRKKKTDTV